MTDPAEPPQLPTEPPKKSPLPALGLALLPTVLMLMTAMGSSRRTPSAWLFTIAGISLFCCFTASFLLFRRKTAWAIVGGLLFLLLNAAIAFFSGCVALFNGV